MHDQTHKPVMRSRIRRWASALRPWTSGSRSTNAFTMMEMMVVTGMLGILMGVAFGGIGQARKQARIAKANAEVRELVNAILAYEASEEGMPLITGDDPVDADKDSLAKLLGNTGGPVYLNVPMTGGKFLDPWGIKPYRFRVISELVTASDDRSEKVSASITFPNRQRKVRW